MGDMTRPASFLVTACLGAALLGGCAVDAGEASHDGQAFLFNETGEPDLSVVVRRADGVRQEDGALEAGYTFDTQFPDRERQCYVASDGYFEVIRPDGTVVVHHDFADRPVCEREEITLEPDGELHWKG